MARDGRRGPEARQRVRLLALRLVRWAPVCRLLRRHAVGGWRWVVEDCRGRVRAAARRVRRRRGRGAEVASRDLGRAVGARRGVGGRERRGAKVGSGVAGKDRLEQRLRVLAAVLWGRVGICGKRVWVSGVPVARVCEKAGNACLRRAWEREKATVAAAEAAPCSRSAKWTEAGTS